VNIISWLAYRGRAVRRVHSIFMFKVLIWAHKLQTASKVRDITTERENIPVGETAVEHN
jgi:hypothetical protein